MRHGSALHRVAILDFILRGRTLLRCIHCGEKLWAQHVNGNDYYREESSLRGIPCPNPRRYIRASVLDNQISNLIGGLRLPESWRDMVIESLNSPEERAQAIKEKARLYERALQSSLCICVR